MLLAYFLTDYKPFLVVFGLLVVFIFLVTVPRWRRHFQSRFEFASQFIKMLETKTEILGDGIVKLSRHEFPKEIYWVDFMIDKSSLRIVVSFHSANGSEPSARELNEIGRTISEAVSVDPKVISELRKTGDEARDNIKLSIDLLQKWFADTWTMKADNDFKLKATFSEPEKIERYNLKSHVWEVF